jgi:hypothetical protein
MLRSLFSSRIWAVVLAAGCSMAPSCNVQLARFGDAEFECVAAKQRASANYCHAALQTWASWELNQNDADRDRQLSKAGLKLARHFGIAETLSAEAGVDCVDQTATAAEIAASIGEAASEVVAEINTGLDLGVNEDASCGAVLVRAAAASCHELLKSESRHTQLAPEGGNAERRDVERERASGKFRNAWARAACPTSASESDIAARIGAINDDTVFSTVVSPVLDDTEFQPISPVGPILYEGATLNPRCGFDDDPDYHFFVKRGSVNKVVVYYQGGGACWENLTCGIPVCKDGADPVRDDPDNASSGFADLGNPDNPFKDWNVVFVTYCTCDIHFGDVDQVYSGFLPDVAISHRGFQNAKVVEKFAREHFLNPDVVFVTGSSAGGYGALFHGPLLHEAWPASRFHVLGDASNGVITPDFLQNEFDNWNFDANVPDFVPGVLDSVTSGEGMPAYIEAVAEFYDGTNWAHYTTSYDGGSGGQTGFYNVMLNGNNPIAALSWWQGSCEFNDVMVDQVLDTFDRVPTNYRYYIGAGSRHTMYGNDKVYSDQRGGESQTIVDWVSDMISYDPRLSSANDWQNVECVDCGLVSPGDPTPPTIPTDPFFQDGADTVILCPAP